jgi:hypothetical protein
LNITHGVLKFLQFHTLYFPNNFWNTLHRHLSFKKMVNTSIKTKTVAGLVKEDSIKKGWLQYQKPRE